MLRKYNVSVSSHLLDVSDKESIEALPQKVIDQHGKVDLFLIMQVLQLVRILKTWMKIIGIGSWALILMELLIAQGFYTSFNK